MPKTEWKFGDVIRRHEDGDLAKQAHVMVIAAAERGIYIGIGLLKQGNLGYRTGETKNRIMADYWTLVDG